MGLIIYFFILFCVVGNSVATTTTTMEYWEKVFPNTPMPSAVKASLPHQDSTEGDKKTSPSVYEVLVNTDMVWGSRYKPGLGTNPDNGCRKSRIFFFEEELRVGMNKSFQYTSNTLISKSTFLTREEADAIPFSSDSISEILDKFSLKPDSNESRIVEKTVTQCEKNGIKGEIKYCATSLESMIDFIKSTLGKKVKAISTVGRNHDKVVAYNTITRVRKAAREDRATICHKENYMYALFYCHMSITPMSSYLVSLEGLNKSSVEAVAVCHKDTTGWNPKHLAFLTLNVKPGTVPVCHFLTDDGILWVPQN